MSLAAIVVDLPWDEPFKWQQQIAAATEHYRSDDVFVFLRLVKHEAVFGADHLTKFAQRLRDEGNDVGFVWHKMGGFFTPRLFRLSTVPKVLEDYIGGAFDASKIRGLMRYRSMTTKDVGIDVDTAIAPTTLKIALETLMLQKSHGDTRYLLPLGIIERKYGDPTAAIAYLDPVISEGPWGYPRATALVNRGRIHEVRNDLPNAFADYAVASLIIPSAEAHFGLARIAFYRGDHRECIRQTEMGWQILAENVDVEPWTPTEREYAPAYCAARSYLTIGRFKEAIEAAERGLRVAPTDLNLNTVKREAMNARAKRQRKYRIALLSEISGLERALVARGHEVDMTGTTSLQDAIVISRRPALETPGILRLVLALDREETVSTEHIAQLFQTDGILAPSEYKQDQLRKAFPFFEDKIHRVPIGIELPSATSLARGRTVAWEGSRELRESVQEIVERAVPDVEFVDRLERASIWASSFYDVTGSHVLRAQAAGCIPVIIDAGANKEFVRAGYLFKPPINEAWVAAVAGRIVKELLRSDEARASVMHDVRNGMQVFAWSRVVRVWEDLFAELLA